MVMLINKHEPIIYNIQNREIYINGNSVITNLSNDDFRYLKEHFSDFRYFLETGAIITSGSQDNAKQDTHLNKLKEQDKRYKDAEIQAIKEVENRKKK